jgi:hypothetical protein
MGHSPAAERIVDECIGEEFFSVTGTGFQPRPKVMDDWLTARSFYPKVNCSSLRCATAVEVQRRLSGRVWIGQQQIPDAQG